MIDLLIKNGTVIDGTGKPAFVADVAVSGDEIIDIGNLSGAETLKEINASGKVVCPGFIDIHSHNDLYMNRKNLPVTFEPFIRQGITTCVTGNCGWGIAPFPMDNRSLFLDTVASIGTTVSDPFEWTTMAEYLDFVNKRGPVINMAHLVPHGPLRIAAMGEKNCRAESDALNKMKAFLEEAMEAGCFGFSTGLMYYPGIYSHTDELIELNKVCGRYGGRYSTHLRAQCTTLPYAVREAVEIAEKGCTGLQISHFHAKPFFGDKASFYHKAVRIAETVNRFIPLPGLPNAALKAGLEVVDQTLEKGFDLGFDMIAYIMANTTLMVVFPPWAHVGGTNRLIERLADNQIWADIKKDMQTVTPAWPPWDERAWSDNYSKAFGWQVIRVLSVKNERNRSLEGKTMIEIAAERNTDPWEAARQLAIEEGGAVTILAGFPPKPWIEKIFSALYSHPQLSVATDAFVPEYGLPPQAAYGTFPRFLGRYVRELRLVGLEEAVRKCTSLSASRYEIARRGEIQKHYYADLVIFDSDAIADYSSPINAAVYPGGIEAVVINGKVVVEGDYFNKDADAGRVLKKWDN